MEGAAGKVPMMGRGCPRDHQPDLKRVVIGPMVNVIGFPLSYQNFEETRADVATVGVMLRMVERKDGRGRRAWVSDCGIISEVNLASLRRNGGQYLVGTPRSKLKQFEAQLLEGRWEEVRTEQGEETCIPCRSAARQAKEKVQAIHSGFLARMEKVLTGLEKRIVEGKRLSLDQECSSDSPIA